MLATRRLAVLAALGVALAAAAPAASATSVTTIQLPKGMRGLAGPALAGDAVAFGRPSRDGYEVVIRRGAHAAVSRVVVPEIKGAYDWQARAQLEASDRRFVLMLMVQTCQGQNACETPYQPVLDATFTGGLHGGKPRRLQGCTSQAQCFARSRCTADPRVDVSGDVVAFGRCHSGIHVQDLGPNGDPAGRDYPAPAMWPRLADPFVAYLVDDDQYGPVAVSNWRTGKTSYTVPTSEPWYDIQSDGKLAYGPRSDQLAWASPDEPFAHVVQEELSIADLGIAGDRLGYVLFPSEPPPLGGVLEAHTLDQAPPPDQEHDPGRLAHAHDTWALRAVDFDGSRLAWIARVCRRSLLKVWDLGSPPPPGPGFSACPIPDIVKDSARFDARGRFRVTLECPSTPPVGCVGYVIADRTKEKWVRYSFPSGEHKRKELSPSLCREASGRVRTKIFFNNDRLHFAEIDKTITVTVHGATAQLPRCQA